jgi:hypothetical protein
MKTILGKKLFGRNFYMVEDFFVAKLFPKKQDEKYLGRNIICRNFFC